MTSRATIVGVASGTPDGGVAIVRLSGPSAIAIAVAIAGSVGAPRRLVRRSLRLGADAIEDGLVVAMPAPGSFTGEDVVELSVHAGRRNVDAVVRACLERGAVAAEAGAFTRRAFEAGRLTLDEAEGIAAIIGAQTEAALQQARRLAAGELGREVDAVAEALAELRAEVEANLDFPEDVEAASVSAWRVAIADARARIDGWLRRFEAGRRSRELARVVLAGPPNAGKSSLFNALLGRERALVAAVPGTTRDYVEAELALDGHACVLVDTAGLREGGDAIERSGIERTRDQLEGADIVLWVEAADVSPSAIALAPETSVVRVESKRDLGCRRRGWTGVVVAGERTGEGVEEVRRAIAALVERDASSAWIGLARHRDRAAEAVIELARAQEQLDGDALELLAFHLGAAALRLAEIRGRSQLGPVGDDVLARVFARFCIGK
ncbi:MAG TPA: tRNA uridine-5-carboxymethylaminomethyl(34) synthesis GTPase MnmE [Nannocystaceae bacterium]|nr:tRNA uridine-5-carboxymethylaminomethyl(34) synthesis GTPase MnmE [Nannocystaceae bacterium]